VIDLVKGMENNIKWRAIIQPEVINSKYTSVIGWGHSPFPPRGV